MLSLNMLRPNSTLRQKEKRPLQYEWHIVKYSEYTPTYICLNAIRHIRRSQGF